MKVCPTCKRSFSDPNLSFCIDDGTPLVKAETPSYDSEATLVSPSPSSGSSEPTETQGQGSAPSDWKGPVYQPPARFAPGPSGSKQRVWPWIVGILVLLLAVAGIGIAAVIFIKIMRPARNRNENTSIRQPNANANTNANANANTGGNSNSSTTNNNANANANARPSDADVAGPPTDSDKVLADLTDIENEWQAANINADKKKLQRILADDYVGTPSDGTMQGKDDYIKDIKPDPSIKHWDFENLELSLNGDRATLHGTVSLEIEGRDEDLVLRFTDKFVWRDGRWQAVGSEVSRVK